MQVFRLLNAGKLKIKFVKDTLPGFLSHYLPLRKSGIVRFFQSDVVLLSFKLQQTCEAGDLKDLHDHLIDVFQHQAAALFSHGHI